MGKAIAQQDGRKSRIGKERSITIPLSQYKRMLEQIEELEDIKAYDAVEGASDKEYTEMDEVLRQSGLSPLRYLRIQAGMSQSELAKKSGVLQNLIAKEESDEKRLSDLDRKKIARALGISFEKLAY